MYTNNPPMEGDRTITPLFSGIQIADTYMSYPVNHSAGEMPIQGFNPAMEPGQTIKLEHGIGLMNMNTNHPMQDYPPMSGHHLTHMKNTNVPMNTPHPRPRKNKEEKLCGVCGDRALGYNFDAISCESCKAFFRRNAPKGLEYFKCPYDERCKMDISNRRFCKRCRLKKCFEIGMRKEYILTDDEKARKKQKIEDNRMANRKQEIQAKISRDEMINTGNSSPSDTSSMSSNATYVEMPAIPQIINIQPQMSPEILLTNSPGGAASPGSTSSSHSSLNSHSSSQPLIMCEQDSKEIDELLQAYSESVQSPSTAIRRTAPGTAGEKRADGGGAATNFSDLVNIAEISVRRVIDMAKKVESFKSLSQLDQISLLKGGSIELLILRSVITFDTEKQHFLDPCDAGDESAAMNTEELRMAENGTGLFEDHMKFVWSLAVELEADQTMLILLLVISLFSPDRANVVAKEQIGRQQERYSLLLKRYLMAKHSPAIATTLYPKLLMKLTDIRNLNEEHSQVLLKVNPDGIQPLMQEVLDLKT